MALIGELATRSEEFRTRWAGHDVRYYRSGSQPFRHPLVGALTLDYDALELPADIGQTIVAYTAEPGSSSADALKQLATSTSLSDIEASSRLAPAVSARSSETQATSDQGDASDLTK